MPLASGSARPEEVRDRWQILREARSGPYKIMHRDYFWEGGHRAIPSNSLARAFGDPGRQSPENGRPRG